MTQCSACNKEIPSNGQIFDDVMCADCDVIVDRCATCRHYYLRKGEQLQGNDLDITRSGQCQECDPNGSLVFQSTHSSAYKH